MNQNIFNIIIFVVLNLCSSIFKAAVAVSMQITSIMEQRQRRKGKMALSVVFFPVLELTRSAEIKQRGEEDHRYKHAVSEEKWFFPSHFKIDCICQQPKKLCYLVEVSCFHDNMNFLLPCIWVTSVVSLTLFTLSLSLGTLAFLVSLHWYANVSKSRNPIQSHTRNCEATNFRK